MEPISPLKTHSQDVEKAVRIFRQEGCREVCLFGSIAIGGSTDSSDIDFGIRGFPRDRFFRIYGRLISELEHDADLVDFERETAMFDALSAIGEIRRLA